MNIVIISDMGVKVHKSWREVSKHYSFTKDDFAKVGEDYVLECDGHTYEISKDIKLLERVASERVFTKNTMDMTSLGIWIAVLLALMTYMK